MNPGGVSATRNRHSQQGESLRSEPAPPDNGALTGSICHESTEDYRRGLRPAVAAIGVTLAVGIRAFITSIIEEQVEKQTGLNLDINGGTTIKLGR